MANNPPVVEPTIPSDAVKADAATVYSSDGRRVETSIVSSSIELSISGGNTGDLRILASDAIFEGNLRAAIAETLDVDPRTVTITTVLVGPDGKLEALYDILF